MQRVGDPGVRALRGGPPQRRRRRRLRRAAVLSIAVPLGADALAADGITTLLASIPEGHLASEGVATKLGLLLTEERAHGERVWRTELSGS